MKKLLVFALTLTLVLASSVYASNSNPETQRDQVFMKNQSASIEISKRLRPKVKADPTNASTSNQLDPEFVKEYGGVYLDSEGILNINLVGDGKNIKAFLKDADVRYHEVNYTLAYLNDVNEAIIPRMLDLDIATLGTDEKNNKVVVYFNKYSDEKANALKKIFDSPAIEVMKTDGRVELTLATGPEIRNSGRSSNKPLLITFILASGFLASAFGWARLRVITGRNRS